MSISAEALIQLAYTIENQPISTIKRKANFTVNVLENDSGLEIIPTSTNEPRYISKSEINDVLRRYDKSSSLVNKDYKDITFNASYILALLNHFSLENNISLERIQAELEHKTRKAEELPQEELINRAQSSNTQPSKVKVYTYTFSRSPYVAAAVLNRANGICEACNTPAPFLKAKDGQPYLEVHHLVQLAKGGKDTIENTKALCPNCHRKLHYGTNEL